MNIEQTYQEDHQLELVVEADQDAFDKAKYLAAKEMARNKKIPGYRPGKAPYQLIVNHFGEGAVVDRALDDFLDEIYPKILDEVEKEPYGPGQVKEIKSLEPPIFVFQIPLQPEVELGDYQDIRVPYKEEAVTDEDVDQVLERMLSQQAEVEPVDHPAEEGSLVDTSISGYPADADPEDEEQLILNEQPLPVMIKSEDAESSKEWPFAGFSRQLLGVSAGDVLELSHQYPDEEQVDEEYRGKDIIFRVQIEGVRQRVLPELDEDFVQSVSELETVDEFMDQLREDLEQQRKVEEEDSYIASIFEALLEEADIKYPPQMLENEIEGEIKELKARLQSRGMDLETYLTIQEMDEESLREEIRPGAEKRVKQGLLIGRISDQANLDISTEEITSEFQRVIDDHFGEDQEAKKAFKSSQESLNLLNRISNQMVSRKTLNYLIALAKGEDVTPFVKQEDEGGQEEAQEEPTAGSASAEDQAEGEHPDEGEQPQQDADQA